MDPGARRPNDDAEMARRPTQLIAIVVVLALVAAVVAVVFATRPDGPPVIDIGAGAGTFGGATTSDQRAVAPEAMSDLAGGDLLWAPVRYRFELADGARIDAGSAAGWQLLPPEDLAAAARPIAERFDVGELRAVAGADGSYVAGAEDGSGPTLWVGPTGDWSYSDPGDGAIWACVEPGTSAPAVDESAADDPAPDEPAADELAPDEPAADDLAPDEPAADDLAPDEPAVDLGPDDTSGSGPAVMDDGDTLVEPRPDIAVCDPPDPPTGVPSADDARTLAERLFAELDLAGTPTIADVHADEWGAWVQASLTVDGQPTDLWASAGWGGDARLTSLSGSLAEPEHVGDYPTIDAERAVERLEAGGPFGAGIISTRPLPADTMPLPMDDPTVSPDSPVSDGGAAPTETGPAEGEDAGPARTAPAPDEAADGVDDQPMPVEPLPEPLPLPDGEAEEVVVTLTGVETVLMLHWDPSGTVWLLPSYRFTDEDGGSWQVLAVTDDYLSDSSASGSDLPDGPADDGSADGGGEPGSPGGAQPEPGVVPPTAPDDGGATDAGPDVVDPSERLPADEVAPEVQQVADEVVGLNEADAITRIEEAGLVARVVVRDGEEFAVTFDLRLDRINLRVADDTVTDATVG